MHFSHSSQVQRSPIASANSVLAKGVLVVALLFGSRLQATTSTWNGAGGTVNWSTAANWGGTATANGNNLIFGGTTRLANTNNTLTGIGSLTFNSSAGAFVLSGNALTIASGVTNSSTNLETVSIALTLTASQTWSATSGNLSFAAVNLSNSAANNTLTVNGGNATSITGIIANGGTSTTSGLTYSGSNTLDLTGVNTYGGATTISSGTLQVGGSGSLGSGSYAGAIANSGTLQYSSSAAQTLSGVISGTGALTKDTSSTSTLDLTGLNTYGGATTISAGTLQVGGSGDLGNSAGVGSYAGAITDNGTLKYSSSANQTLSGIISGTGGLTKDTSSTSTLTLSNANTYTGATAINAGTLSIQNSGALGSGSGNTTVASGATLQMSNNITTTNSGTLHLSGTGSSGSGGALQSLSGTNQWGSNTTLDANATIYNSAAGTALFVGNSSFASTFAIGSNTVTFDGPGDISLDANVGVSGDTGNLIKNGTGRLTFNGYYDNYTGSTTVNSGILDVNTGPYSGSQAGILGSLTIGTGLNANGSVDVILDSSVNDLSANSAVTINSDGVLTVNQSSTTGSLTLNGGQITMLGGTGITPSTSITSNTNSAHETSLISGAQLNLSGATTFTVAHDATLTSDLTVSSVITGTYGVTKQGSGILTFSGANTYTGANTISAGTLSVSSLANGGTASNLGQSTNTATNLVLNGGTLQYTGAAVTTDRLFSVGTSGGTIDSSGSGALNFSNTGSMGFNSQTGTRTLTLTGTNTNANTIAAVIGDNTGATSLVKSGAGTWALSGVNSFTGATTINAGTLQVSGSGSLGSGSYAGAIANSGTLQYSSSAAQTLSGIISGTGALTKDTSSTSTLTLSGTNTYTGATAITSGTLQTTNNASLGSLTGGAVNISGGGTLDIGGDSTASDVNFGQKQFNISGTGVGGNGAIINSSSLDQINAFQNIALTGNATVGGPGRFDVRNAGAGATLSLGTNTLTKTGTGAFMVVGAAITGNGNIIVNGGELGLETYGGDTTANGTGIITYNTGTTAEFWQLNAGDVTTNMVFNGTNTIRLDGGGSSILNSNMAINGTTNVDQATSYVFTLVGNLSGAGNISLNSTGDTGTLKLSGTNTYTGTTTVSAGLLQVGATNATSNASALTVASGATFDLNGFASAVGSIAGAGNVTMATAGSALTIGNDNTSPTFSGVISGGGSLTKVGTGTETLSGANTFTGGLNLNAGKVKVTADTNLGGAANNLTFNGGTLEIAGSLSTARTLTVGAGSTGTLQIDSGKVLTLGTGSVLSAGNTSSILTVNGVDSTGKLTLGANQTFSGTLDLSNATLSLAGFNLTVGTLQITGNSVIDFGGSSSSSILSATSLVLDAGATLTVDNWNDAKEYFYSANNPGTTALSQISWGAPYAGDATKWLNYTSGPGSGHQITPVPEPATYGAIFTAAALGLFFWFRLKANTARPAPVRIVARY